MVIGYLLEISQIILITASFSSTILRYFGTKRLNNFNFNYIKGMAFLVDGNGKEQPFLTSNRLQ